MSMVDKILFLLLSIFSLKFLMFFGRKILYRLWYTSITNKIAHGLVSRKDFCEVPDKIFIEWCVKLLEKLDFKNIQVLSRHTDDNVQMLAYKKFKRIYIKCVVTSLNKTEDEDNFEKVDLAELQRFVGTMEHDNIKYGCCITNADFSREALEYVKTLPADMISLKLIDGCELTRLHRQVKYGFTKPDLRMEI